MITISSVQALGKVDVLHFLFHSNAKEKNSQVKTWRGLQDRERGRRGYVQVHITLLYFV